MGSPLAQDLTRDVAVNLYNKLPWTEWLKQQNIISLSSVGWEVQDQNARQFGSCGGPASWPAENCLAVLTWQRAERGEARALLSLLHRALTSFMRMDTTLFHLITSKRPHLKISSITLGVMGDMGIWGKWTQAFSP
jgi:hypothetical protein